MSEIGLGSGTSFPGAIDFDNTPEVNSPAAGKTKPRAELFYDIIRAILAVQTELGTDPAGTLTDVKTFLQLEHNANGTHKVLSDAYLSTNIPRLNAANVFIDNLEIQKGSPYLVLDATTGNPFLQFQKAGVAKASWYYDTVGDGEVRLWDEVGSADRVAFNRTTGDMTAGNILDARLSSNIPRLNAANVWTADQQISKNSPILQFKKSGAGQSGGFNFVDPAEAFQGAFYLNETSGNWEFLDSGATVRVGFGRASGTMTAGIVPHGRTLETQYASANAATAEITFSSAAVGDLIEIWGYASSAYTSAGMYVNTVQKISGIGSGTFEPQPVSNNYVLAGGTLIASLSGVYRVTTAGSLTFRIAAGGDSGFTVAIRGHRLFS